MARKGTPAKSQMPCRKGGGEQEGVAAMHNNNCLRCGRKVRPEENWVKVHLWASNAVFDWGCFIALLKSHGPEAAEQVAWQGDGHAPPMSAAVSNGVRSSTK